jgi:hypothetical protein
MKTKFDPTPAADPDFIESGGAPTTKADRLDALVLLQELYDEHGGDKAKVQAAFREAIKYDDRLLNAVIKDVADAMVRETFS